MYNLIRKTHLYSGLILLMFVMMYFVSGYVFLHRPWFGTNRPAPTTQTATLQSTTPRTPAELAADVQKQLALGGRVILPAQQRPDATRFSIVRPGTNIRIEVPAQGSDIKITTQRENWAGTLIMLHTVHGYGSYLIFNVYVFICDLAGVAMILFALSGVYLWWKSVKNHLWGVLCLTASCTYGIGMILYMLYAR